MVAQQRDETDEASALIEKWIERDPSHPQIGDARLKEYGVHVWAIIGYLQGARGDMEHVADDFDVPVDAVRAAQAYYDRYAAFIEDRMAANEA